MTTIQVPEENKEAQKTRRFSLVSSILISFFIFLGVLALIEVISRMPAVERFFSIRSLGNYHAQFEIKWFKLEQFVQDNGGVDVILLGNSMTNTGVDPQVFTDEYEKLTVSRPRVFNFGVEGLTVAPNSTLAKLLVETYHPKSVLYFTEIRDYVAQNGIVEEENFLKNDWLRYRLGDYTLKGWLVDHSTALQTILTFRGWTRPDFVDSYLLNLRRVNLTRPNGYEPETRQRQDIDVRPDPNSPVDKPFFELYKDFQIDTNRLDDLQTILSQNDFGTQVFVTEIPVYFTFYDYFGGESFHQAYLQEITQYVNNSGAVFVTPIDPQLIPLDGRADRLHLNSAGAELYSKLLADSFANICLQQHTCLLPSTP